MCSLIICTLYCISLESSVQWLVWICGIHGRCEEYITKLTQWSRVLLEMLTIFQLVKKFSTFYGTQRLITAYTRARHLSLSWARSHNKTIVWNPEGKYAQCVIVYNFVWKPARTINLSCHSRRLWFTACWQSVIQTALVVQWTVQFCCEIVFLCCQSYLLQKGSYKTVIWRLRIWWTVSRVEYN